MAVIAAVPDVLKVVLDFETTTGSGAELSDSPLILIPVQAGLNFLL